MSVLAIRASIVATAAVIVGIVYLVVVGQQKQEVRFSQGCAAAGFTADQCAFLARQARRSDSDSAAAAAMGAAALGVAAAQRR